MRKRICAFIVMLSMLLPAGCQSLSADADPQAMAKGNKWLDSDLEGCLTEESDYRLQDDFAASVNKDWILHSGVKGMNMGEPIEVNVDNNKLALLSDPCIEGKGTDELLKFADLAGNWQKRDSDGVEPLRPYLDGIKAISSVDDFYEWMMDPERNPLKESVVSITFPGGSRFKAEPSEKLVAFNNPDLSLGSTDAYYNSNDLESVEKVEQKVTYVLSKMGYDNSEISKLLSDCFSFEKEMARYVDPSLDPEQEEKFTYPYDQVVSAAGDFPLDSFIKSWGGTGIRHMCGDMMYVKKASSICKHNDIEKLKAWLIVKYVINSGKYLDRETRDYFIETDKSREIKEVPEIMTEEERENHRFIEDINNSSLFPILDEMYVEKYIGQESIDELTRMTEDIIDIYKTEVFPNEEWMSDEGRKLAIEKLDAIVLNIVRPDFSKLDYSDLNITSSEDGGNFLEAVYASNVYKEKTNGKGAAEKYDRAFWDAFNGQLSTTQVNACYVPTQNSINIYAGILADPIYHPGMSKEELYSGIGAVVGHEITHGFDSNGVLYDKDGLKNSWLPKNDSGKFNDKTTDVWVYYDGIEPFHASGNYEGERICTEVIADMGGVRSMLALAKKADSFDYDKFFRHYALMWAAQQDIDRERFYFKTDEHPLNYLRVNVNLQQFDEFIDFYGIKEGDGMYLDPKKRITIW